MNQIRVRIAPTPSGKLHLGTAHTALFNYLFARHTKGKFVLRIDDSDPKRCKKEYETDILESLKWLGIKWDEGPDIGGPYAPYRQSQRMSHYWPYVEKLLKEGKAYYCYCTPAELEKERKMMGKEKKAPKYSGKCCHLTKEAIEKFKKEGREPSVRLKVADKIVSFVDPARGKISVKTEDFGDFVIARSDKTSLLGLATTIDDIEMKITHTIRGEDYLNFVPRQILIFEALGYKPPVFSHLPFVYAPDGSKLSKRHGATAVSDYRKMGYLSEAIFNYLFLLGWSPGDNKEIISPKEAIKLFTLEKVNTNPHRFDFNKLKWVNSVYIKQKKADELLKLLKDFSKYPLEKINYQLILPLLQERIKTLSETDSWLKFLFEDVDYKKELLYKKGALKQLVDNQFKITLAALQDLKDWQTEKIGQVLRKVVTDNNWKPAQYFMLLRVAITASEISLPLNESLEVLGRKKTFERINKALN